MSTKTHQQRSEEEPTRDVIFLFQTYNYSSGGWNTLGVWLDRDEAEAWGQSKGHNLGGKGCGWRVHGVCTEGQLTVMLRASPAAPAVTDTSGWRVWVSPSDILYVYVQKKTSELWNSWGNGWTRSSFATVNEVNDYLRSMGLWLFEITSTPEGQEAIASLDKQLKEGGK